MTDLPLLIGAAMQDVTTKTVLANDERWQILLSPEHTIVELAAIMGGLKIHGIMVEAMVHDDGSVSVIPTDQYQERPTIETVLLWMWEGKLHLPRLVVR